MELSFLICRFVLFFLSLSASVSYWAHLAKRDPAAHSSCTDHKPQQHNKLKLQGFQAARFSLSLTTSPTAETFHPSL
ncbi:hypothetical protein CHARACLAT_016396 [Characodon lateralis]|uniref:Secreted protein n=1 Tax=Characodon lateralis TaxID=208331 RepID=A0ABU7D1N1_9TELE|nr:hypothetical protein [Characodon lateralis]